MSGPAAAGKQQVCVSVCPAQCTVHCVLCTGPSSLLPVIPPSLPAPAFPASSVPAWASHSDAISPSLRSWEVTTSIICETRDQVLEETIIPFLFIVQLVLWSVY